MEATFCVELLSIKAAPLKLSILNHRENSKDIFLEISNGETQNSPGRRSTVI